VGFLLWINGLILWINCLFWGEHLGVNGYFVINPCFLLNTRSCLASEKTAIKNCPQIIPEIFLKTGFFYPSFNSFHNMHKNYYDYYYSSIT
jgi:hypothetical protein